MKRATRFLMKVILLGAIMLGILGILAMVQLAFHPFDGLIREANEKLDRVNGTLSGELVAGISFGTLALVAVLAVSPLFFKGVRARQYGSSFLRSTLAAAIFFLSDLLYRKLESFGRFYVFFSIVFMIVLTFVLVEIISRMTRAEEESSVRTDLLAAIVSGLVFGLIVKLVSMGLSLVPPLI